MSTANWVQLGVFLAVVFACAPFIGKYLSRVFDGERHILSFLAPVERGIYRVTGIGPDPRDELEAVRCCPPGVQRGGLRQPHGAAHDAVLAAAESRPYQQHDLAPRPEHGRQLHDEHELAVVQRRGRGKLSLPDGGPGGAQLPQRRHRHGGDARPVPGDPQKARGPAGS